MPQQKPVSREEKIADALRAAPPHIAASASLVDYDMTVLREGSSEWTCMPTPPDTPVPAPMCGDQTTMQWFRDLVRRQDADHRPNRYLLHAVRGSRRRLRSSRGNRPA
jgi:hypothetical protein